MSETDKQPDPAPQQPDPALMRDENPTRLNLSPKPAIRDISKKPVMIGGGVLLLIAAIATGTFNQAGTNGQGADPNAPEKTTQLPGQLRRDALWYAQVPDSVVRPDPVEPPPMTAGTGRGIPDLTGTAVTPGGSVLAQRTTVPALAGQPPQSAPPQLTPEQQAEQQAEQMARQEAAQREQRRQQQLDAALAGGLASANFTPPKPQDPSRAGGMQGMAGQGGMVPVSAQQQMAGQMQDDPNGQGRKEQFLKNAKTGMDPAYSSSMKTAARSAFELKGGTVIPAVMVNGINSDLPGQVIGQVRENVFDSKSGQHLLIPQGTKLIGLYDSRVAYGQKRILLVWNRLVFADGSSFDLKGMPGTDKAGFAGFEDLVDNHYFKIFGSAALMSLISAGAQLSQPNNTAGTVSGYAPPSVSQTLGAALGQQIGQTSLAITQKNLNIQPTLEVRPGYSFNVMVTADMILPPIK